LHFGTWRINMTDIKSNIKPWAIAFLIGATIGMLVEQEIVLKTIKKDCEILGIFRIAETPYHCKPSIK
jgi:hypothetical protein